MQFSNPYNDGLLNTNKFYHLFIYSDNGSCIYKLSSENIFDQSLQGIFQALFYTATDYNFDIKSLSTDFGLLSFKSYKQNRDHKDNKDDKSLLFAIILPNYYGDEELAEHFADRLLDYIYHALVMHIGLKDLYTFLSSSEIEVLKKLIETYEPTIKYILSNTNNLSLILKSEKKYEIKKEVLYPIKHYLDSFRNFLKVDFLCLTINSTIVWASPDW